MKKTLVAIFLMFFLLSGITVKASYDPDNSGLKYHELQSSFYTNSDQITEIPKEVQEAWDRIGADCMAIFEREKTEIYYTSGVSSDQRVDEEGTHYNGRYTPTKLIAVAKLTKKYLHPEVPGKIYVYSDVVSVETIIHEYGHAIYDIYLYKFGVDNGFAEIWEGVYNRNKDVLATYDEKSGINVPIDAREGFAESFRLLINDPDKLYNNNKEVYIFMHEALKQIKNQ